MPISTASATALTTSLNGVPDAAVVGVSGGIDLYVLALPLFIFLIFLGIVVAKMKRVGR